jgi:hypothetical protein
VQKVKYLLVDVSVGDNQAFVILHVGIIPCAAYLVVFRKLVFVW